MTKGGVACMTNRAYKFELGWWNNELYESLVDSNVYTPDQYAPNWSKQ